MDEFAQTRGADDLFDDEVIPVSAEEQTEQSQPELEVQETPDKHDVDSQPAPNEAAEPPREPQPKSKRGGRQIWRGKRRADRPVNKAGETPGAENETAEDSADRPEERTGQDDDANKPSTDAANQHVPAVRGDRSATGGVRKPKLTDAELDKRVASARENAAKVAAAHARAQADLASFLEREKVEDEKRRVEGENRRAMDSERDQNRQRKLKAVTGREWDATKREEDYSPRGGRGGYRRGMHGAVAGTTRRDFEQPAEAPPTRGQNNPRGRRGRGGRGGSRSPHAERAPEEPNEPTPPPAPAMSSEAEFPALGGGGEKKEEPAVQSPAVEDSWAEEMEAQR